MKKWKNLKKMKIIDKYLRNKKIKKRRVQIKMSIKIIKLYKNEISPSKFHYFA